MDKSSVALTADPGQPALVVSQHSGTTKYEVHNSCKRVMKVISMTTGKTGPEIIKA